MVSDSVVELQRETTTGLVPLLPATPRVTVKSLDSIWPELEKGLTALLTTLDEGMDKGKWMTLYTYVFCFFAFCCVVCLARARLLGAPRAALLFLQNR